MPHAENFFDLNSTRYADLFEGTTYVWEVLNRIGAYINKRFETDLQPNTAGLDVHPSVYIEGPAIIGDNCEIRQGAYIRANTILADDVIVGHATETKNAVLLEHASAPHFAYVGDSVLGQRVNLGAGTKLSNVAVNSK